MSYPLQDWEAELPAPEPPAPEPVEYPRVKLGRGRKPYTYSAPLGMVHAGDVVAVDANWVSTEGTLGRVVDVVAEPPELPDGVQLKPVWRVVPPDELPLFDWES